MSYQQYVVEEADRRMSKIENAIAYLIGLWEDDVAIEERETFTDVLKRYGLEDLTYGEGRYISEVISRAIGQEFKQGC